MENLDAILEASLGPDRETWGTDKAAVRGAQALEALVGGPAAPRS
jgi:hypothetical protein